MQHLPSLDNMQLEVAVSIMEGIRTYFFPLLLDLEKIGYTPLATIEYYKNLAVNGYMPLNTFEYVNRDLFPGELAKKYAEYLVEAKKFFDSHIEPGKGIPMGSFVISSFMYYSLKPEAKLDCLFSVIDLDSDGFITRDDMKQFLNSYLISYANYLEVRPKSDVDVFKNVDVLARALRAIFNPAKIDQMAEDTFEKADLNHDNKISRDEWTPWFRQGLQGLGSAARFI